MLSLVDKVKSTVDTNCRYSPAIEKSIQYIASNYMEKLSLEHVSSRVYLNKSYFSEIFKKETGINYNDYINQVRIQNACELLLAGQHSLSEVAQMVGFSDQNYFSKVFKRITGESPKNFRRKRGSSIYSTEPAAAAQKRRRHRYERCRHFLCKLFGFSALAQPISMDNAEYNPLFSSLVAGIRSGKLL